LDGKISWVRVTTWANDIGHKSDRLIAGE
jgi:hypothetical protein